MQVIPVEQVAAGIRAIDDTVLRGKVQKALHMLHRTLELYRLPDISLSFNGGKDSTVLLHLMRVALRPDLDLTLVQFPTHHQQLQELSIQEDQQQPPQQPRNIAQEQRQLAEHVAQQQQMLQDLQQCNKQQNGVSHSEQGLGGLSVFYFERADDFPEVREFVRETDIAYGLKTHFLTHHDFKAGLEEFLQEAGTAAIVLGTRRGDPNAEGQEYFCPSSAGWPPFMRINPILDWSYADVWGFLKACRLPYCCLYDHGYTSLGGVHNTLPNSALKKSDGTFAPAHALADGRLERSGRATKQRRSESLPSGGAASVTSSMSWVAGIVVIGDEILSGKVEDTNTPFLCKKLHDIGWTVCKVSFVPDDIAVIAKEVAALSSSCQAVVTSGGVGPTLDDVTMEGIAAAFGVDVIRHPDLEESLLHYFGDDTTPAHLKMADTPGDDTTRLIPVMADNGTLSPFPLVAVRNVFVLPGVPHLLRQKWSAVSAELQAAVQLAPFSNRVVRLAEEDEAAVAPLLDTLAQQWGSEMAIGSYPVSGQRDGARLLVTLESKQTDRLDAALEQFEDMLPTGTSAVL
eukprot:GHUV01031051.1.p1 GENE.GHUV01031051.1~~GHUV01031051.1.p1  ORF type:complete len:571 (+),score=152.40 GHUV01031051.1:434-2146(+)